MLDKIAIIENIKALAKLKRINLSELEKESGVSVGYFARLASDIDGVRNDVLSEDKKERPLPGVEVMYKVANILGVSLDKLMDVDFKKLEDPEFSVIFFLDNLTSLTMKNKFIWKKETKGKVLSGAKYDNFEHHPLIIVETRETLDYYERQDFIEEYSYYSLFNEDTAELLSDVYRLDYNKNTFLLAKIRNHVDNQFTDYYELYGIKEDKLLKIAHTEIVRSSRPSPYLDAFEDLFRAASKCADVNPSGDDIIDLINEYIKSLGFEKKK